MFRALFYIYLSLQSVYSAAQSPSPHWSGSAEAVAAGAMAGDETPVDSAISEINCTAGSNSSIILSWKVNSRTPDFFVIERSDNGKSFETVTVLNNLGSRPVYQWTDEAPEKGRSFYRIRYSFSQGQSLYSKTISFFIPGNTTFRFYPNPVDHILIVRSDSQADVQIIDGNGRIRISEPRVEGLHTIDVSSLEKGIYFIRFSNKLTNIISQEKLLKN